MERRTSDASVAAEPVREVPVDEFAVFFEDQWGRSVRLAALLCQDDSVAEEIAQTALARVYERWDALREPGAYLHRCVVNASRMHHRHSNVVRAKLPLIAPAAEDAERLNELADVVARLPFRQRAVIVLRYWCDMSERDIAARLGCRPGTVKSLASRGLQRLAEEVER